MDLRGFGLDDDDLAALGYKVKRGSSRQPGVASPEPAASRPVDPSWRSWAATVAFLVSAVWITSSQRWLPDPVPGNHPDTAFSSARAMSQLSEIARLPRPMGSPEHTRVRTYLVQRLGALGLEPEVQTFVGATRDGAVVQAATVRNVVARVPGVASTGAVALVAHYDGAALSPAAGGGGVGLATVLETVRALVAGPRLRNDLIVVLADGREPGLLGARGFVEHHPWMDDIALVLSVEMWGASGPSLVLGRDVGRGAGNGLVEALAESNAGPAAVPLVTSRLRSLAPEAGVAPFHAQGTRTLSFTAIGGRAVHALPGDTPGRVREATVQHHGVQLLSMARTFGERDLVDGSRPGGRERAYFTAPFLGLVHYPASRTPLVSLALLAGWGLAALALRFRGGTRRGVMAGVVMATVVIGASAALGHAAFGVVRDLHPEFGTLASALYREGLHLVALACMVVACVTAGYGLARRRFGAAELFLGALLIPLPVALWLGVIEPAAAATLQWSLAPALVAGVLLAAAGRGRRPGPWEWMVYALLAAGTLSLLVPSIEVLAGTLTLRSVPLLAALLAMGLLLVLPAMESLQTPRGWWAPALSAAAAAALLTLGAPAVQGGSDHPLPTSLVYLVDQPAADQPAASLRLPRGAGLSMTSSTRTSSTSPPAPGSPSTDAPAQPAARRILGHWLTVPGPGEAWSRSWVAQPPSGSTAPGILFLPGGERYELAGSGPASDVAPPRVRVVSDVREGPWRTVELAVEAGLNGEMLALHVHENESVRITGVGGASWDDPQDETPVRGLMHWGLPEGGALRVLLRMGADGGELTLDVVEHHLRPLEVLGPLFFQRADSIVPDVSTGSDRVIQRTRVRLPLASPTATAAGAG